MRNKAIKKLMVSALVSAVLLTACSGDKEAKENYKKGLDCVQDRQYEEAVKYLSAAVAAEDGKSELLEKEQILNKKAFYALGVSYIRQYDYEKAEEYLKKALDIEYLKDWDVEIMSYRFDALTALDQFEEAYETILLLREDKPKDYDLIMKEFFILQALQKEEEADTLLNEALDIQGKGTQNNYNRAKIYYYLGNAQKAEEGMVNALKKDNIEAKFYMGRICEDAEKYEEAISWYEEFKEAKSKETQSKEVGMGIGDLLYLRLGTCYQKLLKYEEAMNTYTEGISLSNGTFLQELKASEIVLLEKELLFDEAYDKCKQYVKEYKEDETMAREYDFLKTRVNKDKE